MKIIAKMQAKINAHEHSNTAEMGFEIALILGVALVFVIALVLILYSGVKSGEMNNTNENTHDRDTFIVPFFLPMA